MSKKSGNKKSNMSQNVKVEEDNNLYECRYKVKTEKYGFAIPCRDKVLDFYIPQEYNGNLCVMEGDKILVSVVNSEKRVGKIEEILERATTLLIGIYSKGIVSPVLPNLPNISIKEKYSCSAVDGEAVLVEISQYPEVSKLAEGRVLKIVNSDDSNNVYVQALYVKYQLDEKGNFSNLARELKTIKTEVTSEDFFGRTDRTNQVIFTIDPIDAKDIDDAVALEKEGNNYRLSVHIADVSNYVRDETLIDEKAAERGTSIYIPGTCISMLPKILSNDVCSLNEGVLRLSLSVDMLINPEGEVLETNVYKGVIKVTKRMVYDRVFQAIEGTNPAINAEYGEYVPKLKLMKQLAEILKAKRIANGSLDFNLPETKVLLDEEGNIDYLGAYQTSYANNMIEEFMLVANMSVAEQYFWLETPFIYRIHEDPSTEKLQELSELLSTYGITKSFKGGISSKKLTKVLDKIEDEEVKQIVAEIMLRSLKQARYSHERIDHFGLAAKYYCHFTSPIRRYPDLFIHRVISTCIDNNNILPENVKNKFMQQAENYALTSSTLEREAAEIEREFKKLYMCIFMSDKIGEKFDAVVTSVAPFGLFVKLENTITGLISLKSLEEFDYELDEAKCILTIKDVNKVFKFGTKLEVILTDSNPATMQIDFKLA